MAGERDLKEVGGLVANRRGELGLTQQELADAAEVAVGTVVALESGRRWPQAANRSALEKALRWSNGDLMRVKRGGQPSPVPIHVDLGGGVSVDIGDEEIRDPETLRRSLADVMAEPVTRDDFFDRLTAARTSITEAEAIARILWPANNGG